VAKESQSTNKRKLILSSNSESRCIVASFCPSPTAFWMRYFAMIDQLSCNVKHLGTILKSQKAFIVRLTSIHFDPPELDHFSFFVPKPPHFSQTLLPHN
jgi:hypothetical protein